MPELLGLPSIAIGYPVLVPRESYWFVPFSEWSETVEQVLLENHVTYEKTERGILIKGYFDLMRFRDLLEPLSGSDSLVLRGEEDQGLGLVGVDKLTLLSFVIEYGKREWSFHVSSFGCTQNQAEGQNIREFLKRLGGVEKHGTENLDVFVLNSCGVKKQTEDRMVYLARESVKKNKAVVVAGCLPLINPKRILRNASSARLTSPNPVPSIIYSLVNPEKTRTSRNEMCKAPPIKPVFHDRHRLSAIIPIGQGCVGACTFCAVKFARGRINSYRFKDLLDYASSALAKGTKELWITGQDTASYGIDLGDIRLPELVQAITDLPGKFRIRIGMMNPDTLQPIVDDLITVLGHEKVYRFLHIPVQSGSDHVLRLMNRDYTVEEYRQLVKYLRKKYSDITIATDVIVGFPQESREDNQATMDLIEEMQFDVTNISRYMDRPGTKASRMMGKIPSQEMQFRSRLVTEVVNKVGYERNTYWLNWEGEVLIGGSAPGKDFVARNYAYKPIVLNGGSIGEWRTVKVVDVTHTSLLTRGSVGYLRKKKDMVPVTNLE